MAGVIVILLAYVCKVQNILKIIVVYHYAHRSGQPRSLALRMAEFHPGLSVP